MKDSFLSSKSGQNTDSFCQTPSASCILVRLSGSYCILVHIRRVWLEEVQIPLVKLWTKDISYDPKKHIYKPNKLFRYNAVVENEIFAVNL